MIRQSRRRRRFSTRATGNRLAGLAAFDAAGFSTGMRLTSMLRRDWLKSLTDKVSGSPIFTCSRGVLGAGDFMRRTGR